MKASKPGRSPGKPRTDAGIPISLRFLAVYGFVDEYGDRWHWDYGQVVCNPFVIEMLNGRGAPIEVIERRCLPAGKFEE